MNVELEQVEVQDVSDDALEQAAGNVTEWANTMTASLERCCFYS